MGTRKTCKIFKKKWDAGGVVATQGVYGSKIVEEKVSKTESDLDCRNGLGLNSLLERASLDLDSSKMHGLNRSINGFCDPEFLIPASHSLSNLQAIKTALSSL